MIQDVTTAAQATTEVPMQLPSLDIWESKYRLRDRHGNPVDASVSDTHRRVAKALAAVEPKDQTTWEARFMWALDNGAIPAGRITSNAGASEHKTAVSLINCLAGDTPVMTRQGILPIQDLAGKDVEILNGDGNWTTAPFKSFGEQDTFKITLRWGDNRLTKTDVYATRDHRWFLEDGRVVTTEYWLTGGLNNKSRRIPHLFVPQDDINEEVFNEGLIHGLVYGDGSKIETKNKFFLNLCGEKVELVDLLTTLLGKEPSVYDETTRFTVESTTDYKAVPSTSDQSYIKGFIYGALATDGSICRRMFGCEVSLYGDKELVDYVKEYGPYAGIMSTYSRKSAGRGEVTNYGERTKDLWVVGIHPTTIEKKYILRSRHHNNHVYSENGASACQRWLVESVDPTPVKQEVFCCHEYETTAFAIFNGMKTGQCTVSQNVRDSMMDILDSVSKAGLTLKAGCGIGYCFSTIRPRGAHVHGAGAGTNGPLAFMDIFDKMCFTVASAGGRRGAQMGTFDVSHPDVEEFIAAKREDGRLRQFNLSLLITDEFVEAVKQDAEWPLIFPVKAEEFDDLSVENIVYRDWPVIEDDYIVDDEGRVACRVYSRVKARGLWAKIMESTYDYAEPGFILIDAVNRMNNNWWCETITATNPCGKLFASR